MMDLTFAPRGVLQIDNAHLIYRNFKGEGGKYNREGEKNFSVIIDTEEQYDALLNDVNKYGNSWNVKSMPAREEGDIPFMTLPVKVKFNENGPAVYLISGKAKVRLNEQSISILDDIDIACVNLDIRPYDGEVNGKTYRAAYLKAIQVIQEVDRFADVEEADDSDLINNDEM